MPRVAVEFRNVSKSYPGQKAVDNVSFRVRPGEIHGLVGENGAGKTTLIKILAGNHRADAGEILIADEPARIDRPDDAARLGIGFIHQEPALFPTLSVAENLAIGTGYQTTPLGTVRWSRQYDVVGPVLAEVGLDIDPRARLSTLTIHQRQLVALAKVLLQECRVVVLDEVTAPLTQTEVQLLFEILRRLRDRGVAVIYISHRLHEIFDLADRVTVLRNGRLIATKPVAGLTYGALTGLIIGSDARRGSERRAREVSADVVLAVHDLRDEVLAGVTFDLHRGEVLGLAGLAGAGRTNVLEGIFGLRHPSDGVVELEGNALRLGAPAESVNAGIALVTEDRKTDGYVPSFTLARNLTLPWLRLFTRLGVLDLAEERTAAEAAIEEFDVRARSVDVQMSELSGGNQQKAILARWLWRPIKVLLLDEPTHGVDVGAKSRIYDIIRRMAAQGVSIILVSSELEELEHLCDRVLLIAEGTLVGELRGGDIDKNRMLGDLYRAMSAVDRVA